MRRYPHQSRLLRLRSAVRVVIYFIIMGKESLHISSSEWNWEDGTEENNAELFYRAFQRKLEELGVVIPADAKILEIGSGNNVFLRYLQKMGLDAVGVDANPRGEKTKNVIEARIEQLPFPDETFGFIFANFVFDLSVYRQDQLAMVKEIARVLEHGGIFFDLGNEKRAPFEEYLEILSKSDDYNVYRKK